MRGAVIVRLIIYTKGKNAKKYRRGTEYGSARWGGADDIKPYTDPVFENNIPLTQTERLTMNSRPKQPKYARNKNILVIGGSGSGKTRFFVKPSLMQCTSKDFPTSYIVTDPKGTLILETGKMLQRYKYRIKVLNTINFKKSMKYNPFAYLRSEKDILKLVNTIIANTKGDGEKSGEDFWVKAEKLYYTALIGYIWYEAPEDEKNFTTLLEMINASEAREDDEDFQNPVDLMFERLEEKDPEHFAVKQYKKYKLAAGKTAKSILISCGARLAPFDIKELRELMETDEMELDTIGDRKTALFVIISDTDDTFNFVVSILYTQLFNLLCDKADDEYGGRLPVHVRCLLDEFANIGQIPKFEKSRRKKRQVAPAKKPPFVREDIAKGVFVPVSSLPQREPMKRSTNSMNITYRQNGDYLIPNIIIRKTKPLGHYGRLRKAYLEMHRPILFNELVLSDKLFEHCAEIDEAARKPHRADRAVTGRAKRRDRATKKPKTKWNGCGR